MQSLSGKAGEGREHLGLVTGASLKEKLRELPESQVEDKDSIDISGSYSDSFIPAIRCGFSPLPQSLLVFL